MNVIVANEQQALLSGLEIDIIKSISGVFDADELVSMFKNFFFGKMILDITALKDYHSINNLQKLSMSLDVEKIILLIPAGDQLCNSSAFLSKVISMGIYNFTTNLEGIKYLFEHPNSYRDVAHIQQLVEVASTSSSSVMSGTRIIGLKNVTVHAGASTLAYILAKELKESHGMEAVAIEVNKKDFMYFNYPNAISTTKELLPTELLRQKDANVILIDLNDIEDEGICHDVLYLIEPSTLALNKLIRRNPHIFEQLKGKRIVLNKSLLTDSDVADFEFESKSKIFYNMPPLNDRIKNKIVIVLLAKLGIITIATDENDGGVNMKDKIKNILNTEL